MKFYIESYGCTLNHGEARYLVNLLVSASHERVEKPNLADVLIIFTCTVIKTTELKMLRQLSKFTELGQPLVVSGCMAVVQQKDILKINPKVYFLPPADISKINTILFEISDEEFPMETRTGVGLSSSKADTSIDSIIPISTGCLGKCNYCITRLARGELSSHPQEQILNRVRSALATGHYEIRLTAQDTACYGYDFSGKQNSLPELLNKIVRIGSNHEFRIRVGMMNPDSTKHILDKLIKSYQNSSIFKFLHFPVQSGDDKLLHAMGRKYTVSEFLIILKKFRAELPELTLSTDVIVGYPGESTEQFQNSLELIKKIQPNIVNITRFSARPGTAAEKSKNKLSGSEVKMRSRQMTDLRFNISRDLNESKIGNSYRVLVTERVKAGSVLCRSDSYLPIVVKHPLKLGSWAQVLITSATDSYLIGKVEN